MGRMPPRGNNTLGMASGATSKPAIAGPELYMLYLSPAFRASLISDIFGYKPQL
jgi:hypothetical protein